MATHKSFKITVALMLVFFLSPIFGIADNKTDDSVVEESFNPTEMIMHHISDSHGWHFFGEGEDSFTLPLPVILWTDDGITTFMSSEFHHDVEGEHIVERNGQKFVNYHEKIYLLNEGENELKFDEETHAALNADRPFDLS
ncbi:MAG: F0F1 ATP synthase subunit A, partial [Psychroflexus sp.]